MFVFDSELLAGMESVFLSMRYELLVFAAAVAAHFLLFGNASPRGRQSKHPSKDKEKVQEARRQGSFSGLLSPARGGRGHLDSQIQAAARAGDHRQVLRHWAEAKRSEEVVSVSLDKVVESMQRHKKDRAFILQELESFAQRRRPGFEHSMLDMINDLLESLSKRLDIELMEGVVDMLPGLDLAPDQRTYDALLSAHFTCRSFSEVQRVAAEMREAKVPFNTRALLVVIKTALKTSMLDEATLYFRQLKATWGPDFASGSPSMAPRHIVSQIIELACKEGRLAALLPELEGVPLTEQALQLMLAECLKQRDVGLMKRIEAWARDRDVPLSDASYTLLIKGSASDPARVEELLDEVMTKNLEMSADFLLAAVAACGHAGNLNLADRLFQHARPRQPSVLSALVRLYVDAEEYERACDAYASATTASQAPLLDARSERCLMNAALRCGRNQLAQSLLDAAPSDVAKHITMIRNCAVENNLDGAVSIFNSLKQRGTPLNSVVYNSVLDACVECRNLARAEAWMKETKEAGMADVVSYNTLIKAHLHNEALEKARALMEEMRLEGFQPNRVTYNELVNAMVAKGCPIWPILDEMKAAGVQPNQVTCSILLKKLHQGSEEAEILKTMDMISSMEEPMDEVLLSSVVEACVRIGKPDLLNSKLKQLRGGEGVTITGSHTFGSLIKAYGAAGDVNGVWHCWKEMRSRHVRPTSVTLGCMVEAVVSNGDADGAYDLVHQMREDEQCRSALNAVIYCSVLKGFAREKRLERVWAVYAEMQEQNMESIVTYNTIIDACTRCGRMDQVPDALEGMRKARIEPNIITYSTMLKGHCQSGNIQEAFAILKQMRRETDIKPDEVMYNSLMDGCAQQCLVEEGMQLLEEMQAAGVRPSNFSLSVLVKLFSRSRKLDRAFSVVRELSSKYRIRLNVHVHTNLIQACISARQTNKALNCLDQMLQDGIQPNERTYAILLRALAANGQYDAVAGVLRAALGLDGMLPSLARHGSTALCKLENNVVNQALMSLAEGCQSSLALDVLAQIKEKRPHVRVDAATQGKILAANASGGSKMPPLTAGGTGASQRPYRAGKGGGRGGRP